MAKDLYYTSRYRENSFDTTISLFPWCNTCLLCPCSLDTENGLPWQAYCPSLLQFSITISVTLISYQKSCLLYILILISAPFLTCSMTGVFLVYSISNKLSGAKWNNLDRQSMNLRRGSWWMPAAITSVSLYKSFCLMQNICWNTAKFSHKMQLLSHLMP